MPENSAAVSLPPTAKTRAAPLEARHQHWKTTASAIMTIGASQSIGTPSDCQSARQLGATDRRTAPSVMMNAMPREMPITPSVAMNGGSLHADDQPATTTQARRDADQQPGDRARRRAASPASRRDSR